MVDWRKILIGSAIAFLAIVLLVGLIIGAIALYNYSTKPKLPEVPDKEPEGCRRCPAGYTPDIEEVPVRGGAPKIVEGCRKLGNGEFMSCPVA